MASRNSNTTTNYAIYMSAENIADLPRDHPQRTRLMPNEFTFIFRLIQTRVSDGKNAIVQLPEQEKTLEFTHPVPSLVLPGETLRGHVSTMLSNLQQTYDDPTAILSLPLYRETSRLHWKAIQNPSDKHYKLPFEAVVFLVAVSARFAIVHSAVENTPRMRMVVTIEKRNGVTTKPGRLGPSAKCTMYRAHRMAVFERSMRRMERDIGELREMLEKELECAICIEKVLNGKRVGIIRLSCSHAFHFPCLFEWLRRKDTCPVCRFRVAHL